MGSVAESVLSKAKAPVLVVKANKQVAAHSAEPAKTEVTGTH